MIGRGSNDFEIQTLNDTYTSEATAMQIIRSGTSISNVNFPNGNVGVGTTTPLTTIAATRTLDVAGSIQAEGGINKGPTNIPLFRWLPVMMTTYTGTGSNPEGIAFDGTNMWTANYGGNSVTKITPTGTMTTYTGTGSEPYGIAFDGTNMWTANIGGNSVSMITPTGTITTYTGTGNGPLGIAFDGTNMWTANYGGNVTKILVNRGY